jgi:hypothetical protein
MGVRASGTGFRTRAEANGQGGPMPSTTSAAADRTRFTATELDALTPAARRARYERGELSRAECWIWAARYPEEPPTINGEFAWIGLMLADLD